MLSIMNPVIALYVDNELSVKLSFTAAATNTTMSA